MKIRIILFIYLFTVVSNVIYADNKSETVSQAQKEERFDKAFRNAEKAAIKSPVDIPLLEQAILNLPDGYLFIPQKEATELMNAMGSNVTGSNFLGLIVPDMQFAWGIKVMFHKEGYISDEEAMNWNADQMLQSLIDGTESSNAYRIKNGFDPLEVGGWAEKPHYNSADHRLIWSIFVKNKLDLDASSTVNYHTYALGREGYFNLTLIADEKNIQLHKEHAWQILSCVNYHKGKGYEDFQAGDSVAKYGLSALIIGAVAKKAGWLATFGLILAKSWKSLIAIVALMSPFFGSIKTRIRDLFKK